MITVDQALQIIAQQATCFQTEDITLLQSVGRILAQPVLADRDFPPFHRATMDGIAVSSQAFEEGARRYHIESVQPAGAPQRALKNSYSCIEIMTGAVLPKGTDAVIRYEDVEIEDELATINLDAVKPYQNVHLQGTDEKAGEVLVQAGVKITPATIAAMATVGLAVVKVYTLPRVAVCSTGDELVPVNQLPQPHQIRQSNSYMLLAALQREGIMATAYHLPDNAQAMTIQMESMMQEYDVWLFSGAVSKGKYDFLPQVLQQLDMQTLFHSVAQKPGKPMLFGKFENGPVVFGFPGNPVSTWMCYQVFFKAWLYKCLNMQLPAIGAALGITIVFKPALTHHVLVKIIYKEDRAIAEPIETSTSGDMVNLMKADGFLSLPAQEEVFTEGRIFEVRLF